MKIKTKLASLCLVVLLTVFLGCSEDIYENSTSHSNAQKEKYKISFAQFKREKGIKNFDLLKTIKSTSINAREEGTDKGYVIDTTTIYRYTTQNNKITYSFKIYPIYQTLEDKEYYNLVYEKFGDQWNEIIFKNKEKDSIISGEPKTESSEMLYYKGFNTSITLSDFCQTITLSVDCDGSCGGYECDGFACPTGQCITESISYWPCEDPTTIDQTIAEPISGSSAGAGSGGNALSGIYIPNPYNGDADINNAEFMLACQVTAYTNLLSQNFPSIGATLTFNPWMHSNIIDFVRNNGNELTPRNQNAIFSALNNILPIINIRNPNMTFVQINTYNYNAFIFFLNHTDVNSNKYLNWFSISTPGTENIEAQDISYWSNPSLTFPQQDLPTFDDFFMAYPPNSTTALSLCTQIGGEILTLHNNIVSNGLQMNTCAIRLSRALNYSGTTIPNVPGTKLGGDGKYYFTFASDINKWMRLTFGTNPIEPPGPLNVNHYRYTKEEILANPQILAGKQGIFSMVSSDPNWSSGHSDLLFGDVTCLNNCHFEGPILHIDIWVLE